MEERTAKGRGRPRKNPPTHNAVGEGESPSPIDIRERETSGDGQPLPSVHDGKGEGCSFAELVEIVRRKNSHDYRISCVIHTEADGVIQTDNLGNIRTEKGLCGYQLNTGEIVLI